MTAAMYFRSVAGEFVLVALASVSLSYILLDGFYVAPEVQQTPLPGVLATVLALVFFLVSYNKKSMRIGTPLVVLVLVVLWAAGALTSPDGQYLVDTEGNNLIFLMTVSLTSLVCFLLSRRRFGTALLFIIGVFLAAFIQFFYEFFEVGWTVTLVFSTLALIIYKNYQLSVRAVDTLKKVKFLPGFAVSLGAVCLAVGMGCVVWFGIIAPLNPAAVDIKLITEYRALETLFVKGTSSIYQTPNLDLSSDQVGEGERTTDDLQIDEVDGVKTPAHSKETQVPDETQYDPSGTFLGVDFDSLQELFDSQTFEQPSVLWWLLLLLIPLALAAFFVGRRIWRAKRLERYVSRGSRQGVIAIYTFLVSRLARLGMGIPRGETLLDFAESTAATLGRIDAVTGVKFANLTKTYVGVVYGEEAVKEQQIEEFKRYYEGFWKASRSYLGNVKYFFKSFRL